MDTERKSIGEYSQNILRNELREVFTVQWLRKYKGFEKLSEQKAKLHIESMIELSIVLCNFLIAKNVEL